MSKFKKSGKRSLPGITMASMSDIVFMLLFFFMVTTTMRDVSLKVKVVPPQAVEVQKLEKKALVSFIYIGPPTNTATFGTESRIQLNDSYQPATAIPDFILAERNARNEADRNLLTTSLKVDQTVKMGIVTDVKQELRKVGAFKINYSTRKKMDK